jgi:hypothetical protein
LRRAICPGFMPISRAPARANWAAALTFRGLEPARRCSPIDVLGQPAERSTLVPTSREPGADNAAMTRLKRVREISLSTNHQRGFPDGAVRSHCHLDDQRKSVCPWKAFPRASERSRRRCTRKSYWSVLSFTLAIRPGSRERTTAWPRGNPDDSAYLIGLSCRSCSSSCSKRSPPESLISRSQGVRAELGEIPTPADDVVNRS